MSHGISGLQRIPNSTEAEDVKTWNRHGSGAQRWRQALHGFRIFFCVFHREKLVDFSDDLGIKRHEDFMGEDSPKTV